MLLVIDFERADQGVFYISLEVDSAVVEDWRVSNHRCV